MSNRYPKLAIVRIPLGQKMLNVEEICLFMHFRFKTPKFEIWISLNSTFKKRFGNLCRNNGLTQGISSSVQFWLFLSLKSLSLCLQNESFFFGSEESQLFQRCVLSKDEASRMFLVTFFLPSYKAKIVKNHTRKEKPRSWIRYSCIIEWVLGG